MKKFWLLYWLTALLLSTGSILMRCWEDGGVQNLSWWAGIHFAGWLLFAVVVWLLGCGPLRGFLDQVCSRLE